MVPIDSRVARKARQPGERSTLTGIHGGVGPEELIIIQLVVMDGASPRLPQSCAPLR
jgi:hypothetical protein